MTVRHAFAMTDIGEMLLVANGDALIGAYFENHAYPPKTDAIGARVVERNDSVLTQAHTELNEYLRSERRTFTVQTHTASDSFNQRVWSYLLELPYGSTTTYGAIAAHLGNTALAQRVGQAVGHNPIMIIVPCHRVLGSDGSLTGYAGGLDRKRRLLALEEPNAAEAGRLF